MKGILVLALGALLVVTFLWLRAEREALRVDREGSACFNEVQALKTSRANWMEQAQECRKAGVKDEIENRRYRLAILAACPAVAARLKVMPSADDLLTERKIRDLQEGSSQEGRAPSRE